MWCVFERINKAIQHKYFQYSETVTEQLHVFKYPTANGLNAHCTAHKML